MIRYLLIVVIYFVLTGINVAQTPIDSINNIINAAKGKEKVDLQNKFANEFLYESIDNSYIFAEDALKNAKRIGYINGQVDALLNLGNCFNLKYEDSLAIDYFFQAYQLSEKGKYNFGLTQSLMSIGLSMYYINQYDSSLYYSNKALKIASKTKNKSDESKILQNIGNVYKKSNSPDTALEYYLKSLSIREELNDYKEIAKSNTQIGLIYFSKGNFNKAIEYYKKAIKLRDLAGDLWGKGLDSYNIGNAYMELEKSEEAIEYIQNALSIFEKLDNKQGIGQCNQLLGIVNDQMENSSKALIYYQKAQKIYTEIGDKNNLANVLDLIGTSINNRTIKELMIKYSYSSWEDSLLINKPKEYVAKFDTATIYYKQALVISKDLGNYILIWQSLHNIGTNLTYSGEFNEALKYYEQSLEISNLIQDEIKIIYNVFAIGRTYNMLKQYNKALNYLLKYINKAEKLGKNEYLSKFYEEISTSYQGLGNNKKALEYFVHYTDTKEKFLNEERMRQTAELETKYETEKKESQIQLLDKENKLQEATIERRNQVILFFIVGFILILASAAMLLRLNRRINKANVELAHKNEVITKQKEEITDSIKYARRIQRAVLPSTEVANKLLPEHFILFRPRDIVSGDFYWIGQNENKIVVVAADCTGHGVPGAFMSMLGVSFLNEIVNKEAVTQANLILNELRSSVKTTLSQTGAEGEAKDGMDIALLIIDMDKNTIQYAGAYNPLYFFHNGELNEIKADKMPIGIYIKERESFTNNEIKIAKGDTFYIFSDGYIDQFGGADRRKFMSKTFKELLTEIQPKPLEEQREILDQRIDAWRGDIPQVDDMIVIGLRFS